MMNKIFLLLVLFSYQLFACATCALMTPTVKVDLDLQVKENTLKRIYFKWTFSDIYTKELTTQYDKNKNALLDPDELKTILQIKTDYLQPKNMLTQVFFNELDKEQQRLDLNYKNLKIYLQNNELLFTYETDLDFYIKDNSQLSFAFSDDEGFFSFIVHDLLIPKNEINYTQNLYLFTASILFSQTDSKQNTPLTKTSKHPQEIPVVEQQSSLSQENILKKSIAKIKSLFESIKDESNPLTYLSLLFFAYMYGVIHAMGPGHGKTLVASYFLSNEKSYTKALLVSLAIGVVHTFSAFLLTVAIYFFLDVLFAQFVDNAVFYTTKVSALIIIVIAIYLLNKKHKAYKALRKVQYTFSASPHPSTCGCGTCKVDKDSTDAALIISAGIIPCPGTITIFIFSLSLGLYYAGFLAALVMSLGMSTIIFFSAILSVLVRKKTSNTNLGFKKFLEYASLFIILILGLILLF